MRAARPGRFVARLDAPLLTLSPAGDVWRVEDACAGLSVLGANGSGKTTGSGRAVAQAFLRAGWGGLVLCAKADEADRWERTARDCGRGADVVRIGRDRRWRFDFIAYELGRSGDPGARVDNLLSTLMNLMDQQGRTRGSGDARFWQQAAEALLRHTLTLLVAARERFTLFDVQQTIDAAPLSETAALEAAAGRGAFGRELAAARKALIAAGRLADHDVVENYFTVQFPRLAERTRSSITITLATMLQDLLTGLPRELFSTGSTVFPEDSHEGAILLLDLPVIENRANRTAQTLFKTVWQQAALRRQGGDAQRMRPTFLWADEAHFFVTEYDAAYQSLARSAKACTVFLSQNLANYQAELGERGEVTARRLLGLFQTQIFHAQSDPATIEHVQRLFGKQEITRLNRSFSVSRGRSASISDSVNTSLSRGAGGSSVSTGTSGGVSLGRTASASGGWSESTQVEDTLFASHLTLLPNGSDSHGGVIGGFLFKNAAAWAHGSAILYVQFRRGAA